jgi:hypothetical protein
MEKPADYSALNETIERAMKSERARNTVEDRGEAVEAEAPFPTPERTIIAREGDTEYLLNGLIAECHYMMRELALPTAARTTQADQRVQFISVAIDLAQTGASVGKAVAKLRAAGQMSEPQQSGRGRVSTEKTLQT